MCLPVLRTAIKPRSCFITNNPRLKREIIQLRPQGQTKGQSWDPTQVGKKSAGKADTNGYQAMSPSHLVGFPKQQKKKTKQSKNNQKSTKKQNNMKDLIAG